jgi:hypothetical protein
MVVALGKREATRNARNAHASEPNVAPAVAGASGKSPGVPS